MSILANYVFPFLLGKSPRKSSKVSRKSCLQDMPIKKMLLKIAILKKLVKNNYKDNFNYYKRFTLTSYEFLSFSFQTEQFTVLWILFAVIVLGNTAVLVTLFINKSRKSRMNFFIRHLAIAGKDF
jgi:hypothetical protein